ncbi:Rrf2 family transcriptional regulator [Vagococcus sp. BWB3-3]|uniref:Rrf2 family transcriptional regulator n=1 Tax=Vagococcus allomyrinae TaxID=2794353 RepID=A0A940PEM0_9ENTE|nr:Rrf2 family transcriptional regulator [Vagococcus allomyrinae]MBP1041408.1 Rrf2 family transcriptional regulator [Vagococcus allomyrinae]
MKLTNATEQALAIMAMLSMQPKNVPVSSESIYTKLSVSQSYIKKLLRKLVVSKLIGGVSGNNGGFYLEKETSEISLLEIVEAIEGPLETFPDIGVLQRAFSEFDEYAQNGHSIVSSFFSEADRLWEERLRQVSVREVLEKVFEKEVEIPTRDWNQI